MRVVLTGGGTGGHLFAAIAFGEYLKQNGYDVVLIGSEYGIESRILKDYNFEYFLLKSRGIAGKSFVDKLKNSFIMVNGFFDALSILKKIDPVFCVGFGGYVSLPVMSAALVLKKTTAIVEQNSIPGKTNKLLGRFVDLVFVNFEMTANYFKNACVVGNPTRLKLSIERDFSYNRLRVGVIGGSRGARRINQAMIELSAFDIDIDVIHQTGDEDYPVVSEAYKRNKKNWQVFKFIDDMEWFYKSIDFIICRAGASTLSEIACSSLPGLLVPYPYAIYNHQYHNAKFFEENGAGWLINDKDLSGKKIHSFISSLTVEKLRVASKNASKLCKSDSCEKMIKKLKEIKR
ncbi:undecaprenyldiphospho-muramoylpentapeptide beta-N-acetylglucosaminyltransferase [Hippea jasoniae]|uniref:undecaprenyldiphospho-muramoylpentapeptide beta-N-acetylglucosaminyltransferase n=1 Tax=Hippea jasoniae TaxID=944479 RepID=UPI0005596FAB|nr:undecaprenyldiphospho-muramoylpentapeptide beta-N-acetylglucosaminyltransferase [Hippea jasoniae]